MNLQPIFDLAEICHRKGIKHAVISPGSRNAALTIAFARHPDIQCFSVPDERSAAFIALGMSLKTKVPTVLICTSGSAALNYAPAVSESFFNQVPLLILSADRPPEWIGQRDGQTIYQEGLFGKHVKQSLVFPSLDESSDGHTMISGAIDQCLSENKGPVHINIPFREPFYPKADTKYNYNVSWQKKTSSAVRQDIDTKFAEELDQYSRILIVAGQDHRNELTLKLLSKLSEEHKLPVVADIISNAHEVKNGITGQDLFLKNYHDSNLNPDLLITVGMSVISKNLKLYLRDHKPTAHWHVRNEPESPDTYLALTDHIKAESSDFLEFMAGHLKPNSTQSAYYDQWQAINQASKEQVEKHSSSSFTDFAAYRAVIRCLPNDCDLHLANSMAVRYANVIGLSADRSIEVYCNRGTSGIDGSNSTAVGSALMTARPTFLLTGDMAFLYDKNAFWHNHLPDNLTIVIFNNHGGGIFRMIDGPSSQPELEEYFETRQNHDAKSLADEYGFPYHPCRDMDELQNSLPDLMRTSGKKILEIFTDAEESKKDYKELFARKSY